MEHKAALSAPSSQTGLQPLQCGDKGPSRHSGGVTSPPLHTWPLVYSLRYGSLVYWAGIVKGSSVLTRSHNCGTW